PSDGTTYGRVDLCQGLAKQRIRSAEFDRLIPVALDGSVERKLKVARRHIKAAAVIHDERIATAQCRADYVELRPRLARYDEQRNAAGPQFTQGLLRGLKGVGRGIQKGAIEIGKDDKSGHGLPWSMAGAVNPTRRAVSRQGARGPRLNPVHGGRD